MADIPAFNLVTTKLGDTAASVRFDIYDGRGPNGSSVGELRFSFVITGANVTSINTTVNGGAAGTTLTISQAQNAALGADAQPVYDFYLPNGSASRV